MTTASLAPALKRLSPSGAIGLVLVAAILAICFLGPFVWRVDPEAQSLIDALQDASLAHPLGTDQQGRDLLARIMAGGRLSVTIGFASMVIGLVCGAALGVAAGFSTGLLRNVLLRVMDAMLSMPGIVQAIIFVAVFGQGALSLTIALGIYGTPVFARVCYNATRQLRELDYVVIARAIGSSTAMIVWRHILPNLATPLIALGTLRVGTNILTGAALNFFGLGVQPPAPEWGLMIAEARAMSWSNPMLLVWPGLFLFLTSLGFSLGGDGLRDYLDPKDRAH